MKLNFQWKQQMGQFQNGSNVYLNRIMVGQVCWNSLQSRDTPKAEHDAKQYIGSSYLFTGKSWFAPTEQDAKTIVEQKVNVWFVEALKDSEVVK
jgi:hypothetical protein